MLSHDYFGTSCLRINTPLESEKLDLTGFLMIEFLMKISLDPNEQIL